VIVDDGPRSEYAAIGSIERDEYGWWFSDPHGENGAGLLPRVERRFRSRREAFEAVCKALRADPA